VLLLASAGCSSAKGPGSAGSTAPTVPAPTTVAATDAATTSTTSTTPTTTASTATTATTTAPTTSTVPPPPAPVGPQLSGLTVATTKVADVPSAIAMAVRAGDPALYVASKEGKVFALGGGDPTVVLDISSTVSTGGEQGLLGIAFAPDGSHLYVSYTDGDGTSTLDEYEWSSGGRPDRATRRTVLTQPQPYANHNGGNIVFGPDAMLYYGFGDGGSANDPQRRAQKLDTLLGKLLRIDPRAQGESTYGVPADNPLVGEDGTRSEIWAWGLRNPWRFSFDRANGDLWIGDVGQGAIEEVDHVTAATGNGKGADFGWSAWEGTHRFNQDVDGDGATPPVHEYPHGDLGCSITGGYVYRGTKIPALAGAYLYGDYCAAGIRAIDPGSPAESVKISDGPKNLSSFGEGQDGELYALSLDGAVYRIDPA
jgi:glucose/arabinose dehydrogenase